MGFFAKNTYKGICQAMLRSYKQAKEQNPDVSAKELYALALSQRPTYKRKSPESFIFITRKGEEFKIGDKDTFKDVVLNVINHETIPTFSKGAVTMLIVAQVVLEEEFSNFEE